MTTSKLKSLLLAPLAALMFVPAAPVLASEPFLGQVQILGFGFAPRGWALCDGQLLSISQNSALFSLLGTTFGGDGETTFALPDLRGRIAIHPGTGPGLSPVTWGQRGGQQRVTLSVNNMPSHTHNVNIAATTTNGNQTSPANAIPANDPREDQWSTAAGNTSLAGSTASPTGAGQSFENRQPYLGLYHAIALTGIFPSRN